MQYRPFGKLDWKVSALGFGTMRLPINGADQAAINEPEAIKLIRFAIDAGVNYVDSAYVYHEGNSEVVLGKALEDGYRDKVKIATKMPVFSIQNKEDLDRIFETQLIRLKTDCIDFYLLHALMKPTWDKVKELNIIDWAEQKIAQGKIGYLGFSFHDEYEVFKEIVDSYKDWTFCQIQYNYLDEHYQAGKAGLQYAATKGLAVIVMEPLAGGLLAVKPPEEIQQEWDKTGIKRPPADWALEMGLEPPRSSNSFERHELHDTGRTKFGKRKQFRTKYTHPNRNRRPNQIPRVIPEMRLHRMQQMPLLQSLPTKHRHTSNAWLS